jgi:hypothetical protein
MAVNRKRKARANRVDAHVGRRLRQRRLIMRMGVKKLAKVIDVGHRQIQKYELGLRIPREVARDSGMISPTIPI